MRLLLLLAPWFCSFETAASGDVKKDKRLDYSKIYELGEHCNISRFLVGARRDDQKNLAPLNVSDVLGAENCDAVSLILSSTSNQQVLIDGSAKAPDDASLVAFTDSRRVPYKSGNQTRYRVRKEKSIVSAEPRKRHRIHGRKKQLVVFKECFIDFSTIHCPVVDREEQTVTLRRWFVQGNEILDDETDDRRTALRIRFDQDARYLGKIYFDSAYNDIAITFNTYNGHESKKVSIRSLFALQSRGLLVIPKFMPQMLFGVTSAFSHRYMWVSGPPATADPLEVYRSERLRPYISQKVKPIEESKYVWDRLIQHTGSALNSTTLRQFTVVMNPNFTRTGLFNTESRAKCYDMMQRTSECLKDLKAFDWNPFLIIIDGCLLGVLCSRVIFIVICLKRRRRQELRRQKRLRKQRKKLNQRKKTPADPTKAQDPVQKLEADVDPSVPRVDTSSPGVNPSAPGDVVAGATPKGPADDDDEKGKDDGKGPKKEGFLAKKVAQLLKDDDDDDDDEADPDEGDERSQKYYDAHEQFEDTSTRAAVAEPSQAPASVAADPNSAASTAAPRSDYLMATHNVSQRYV